MPKHIPTVERGRTVALKKSDWKFNQISSKLGIKTGTCSALWRYYVKSKPLQPKKITERLAKMNDRDKRSIVRNLEKDRKKKRDYRLQRKNNIPIYNEEDIEKTRVHRQSSCKKTAVEVFNSKQSEELVHGTTPPIFSRLAKVCFFTDESKFGLRSDGRDWVYRRANERCLPKCTINLSSNRRSVMVWAAIFGDGSKEFKVCPARCNSDTY